MRITKLLAIVSAGLLASASFASVTQYAFRITATNAQGSASFDVPLSALTQVGDRWTWSQMTAVDLEDTDGDLIARLDSANGFYVGDPQVNLGFAVVAGAADTVFTLSSGVLSFSPLTGQSGRASAALTITDADFSGAASLVGLLPGTSGARAYQAYYNGATPGAGTIFSSLIDDVIAPPGGSFSESENDPVTGLRAIPGTVSSMSVQLSFRVSANDSASGTTNFVVIPEPAALGLLLTGLVGMLRRR